MSYWFYITNEDKWKVIKEKNIWEVADSHKILSQMASQEINCSSP